MRWLSSREWYGWTFVFFALLASGCGTGMPSSVSGSVTLDGKPVSKGNVSFMPVTDGATAYGTIAADGTYTLSSGSNSGANPGDYVVVVVVNGDIPPPVPGKTPENPKALSPIKYASKDTSDLKVTVKAGPNVIPLEMKSP